MSRDFLMNSHLEGTWNIISSIKYCGENEESIIVWRGIMITARTQLHDVKVVSRKFV